MREKDNLSCIMLLEMWYDHFKLLSIVIPRNLMESTLVSGFVWVKKNGRMGKRTKENQTGTQRISTNKRSNQEE